MKILLGFEVGTGEEVYVEDGHTVVTGMTQLSGKTTCLEALVERGDVGAITFLTKRGEKGFRRQREIPPYFREQKKGPLIDWQYVSAILEATMSERMKFERSWIINACKGAHNLQEVYDKIKTAQEDAKRSLDKSVYTNLAAYFEIVLPEIKKHAFADSLALQKGFNVMNLIGMADEMQQLVIESVLSYVLNKMTDVIIVLPEAHKFIPQGFNTPVKKTALRFIREGATNGNFMWIDTQETTSVDKAILKQCANWIMGYQQEKNEVANVRENIGRRKIKEEDIMSLKLGHFIASLQQKIYHVYVLPSGIDEKDAYDVAMGVIPPEAIRSMLTHSTLLPLTTIRESYTGREEEYQETTAIDTQDLIKLRTEVTELSRKIVELEDRLEKASFDFAQEKQRFETEIETLQNEKKELNKTIKKYEYLVEQLTMKVELFSRFEIVLRDIIVPLIPKPKGYVDKTIIAEVVTAELNKMTPKRRKEISIEDTKIPWINLWLPKVGKAEQKILKFMADKYPLKMTKSEIAIGIGLTAKGGYFSGAFNRLKKNKLIVAVDGQNYTIAETPK